jgi:hypothetical protein
MTVSNVILEPHRVRLMQDTLIYRHKKPFGLDRKMKIVKNSGLVFTVRGDVAIGDVLEDLDHNFSDFETAIAIIGYAVSKMSLKWIRDGAEITVLAWDNGQPKASRIKVSPEKEYALTGSGVINTAPAGAITVRRFDLSPGVYLAPSLGSHDIKTDLTDEHLLKIAFLQQEIALRHNLNMCVGGDVEVVTIDAAGITVRKLGEYSNKALTIVQIAKQDAAIREKEAA